ncbi:MAG: diaminopimelate epimerase [Deltaproteobacteria bacterium RIFOXYD12_FULL_57_12]|nr:MAG: diaminopimelate epimerase [Deltaproteobacteria bacterium RIFOXYD12_FULL_57_12]
MSGSGNDFIIIDHRRGFLGGVDLPSFVRAVCRRRFAVGADGLILIEDSETADFRWQFFNGDGSRAEMCGNGARCAARYAYLKKIAPAAMRFETVAGLIEAQVMDGSVKIKMTQPDSVLLGQKLLLAGKERVFHSINTGVPHAVHFVADAGAVPVVDWGRPVRFHEKFQPAGTNVNFVQVMSRDSLAVRTYERGVEAETMACGTGAAAAAIIGALLGHVAPPVTVVTSGGARLTIHFVLKTGQHPEITEVFLEGRANVIYEGQLAAECLLDVGVREQEEKKGEQSGRWRKYLAFGHASAEFTE